ncbi:heme NO-binding domain-containing protein [Algoriphagus sp.]|uniref:heme NO-binding domain-containing protein n=1 Tax=Algoriphagus sp. TaxID=1872435 RepID=UPI0025D53152|nr:heme NO-binding domain-containing protein [Algoriphagus sp.]
MLHYISKRKGLAGFMKGLISGLGKMFETPVEVIHLHGKEDGHSYEAFKVKW